MARPMTPARRAALKKAQAASAAKRRGTGKKKVATGRKPYLKEKANVKKARQKKNAARSMTRSYVVGGAPAMIQTKRARKKLGKGKPKPGEFKKAKADLRKAKLKKRAARSMTRAYVHSGAIGMARTARARKKVSAPKKRKR